MMMFSLVWLLILVVIVLRFAERNDARRRLPREGGGSADAELARLREDVDRLSSQVERLLEEQSFVLRLLESGQSAGAAPPPLPPAAPPPAAGREITPEGPSQPGEPNGNA
jgi:hypothetical protein